MGVCSGCDDDVDCPRDKICDRGGKRCVFGCRPGAQPSNAGNARGYCLEGQSCVPLTAGGDIGQCVPETTPPIADAGAADGGPRFLEGSIEGAGCSCETASLARATTPFACLAGAISAMMLLVRRSKRRKERR
jgi:hypothetical protein